MVTRSRLRTAVLFLSVVALVVGLSTISTRVWRAKPEQPQARRELLIEKEMTIIQFGESNQLSNQVLKEIFGLKSKSDLEKKLSEYGSADEIASLVTRKLALASEHASKNWVKILVKFLLWFLFLSTIIVLLKNRRVTSRLRNWLLMTAILIFGVVLGPDPSPMGTVKDAIHLYTSTGAIFLPRMVALSIFLAIVFVANKFICAWGCQVGTLQDLIFRINQTEKSKAVIGKQIKLPFALTNTVRFMFLGMFTLSAFLWRIDIIDPVDPFKIYNPAYLSLTGGLFLAILFLASLFIYRPWCHLFCPFGLVGWLVEKVSLVRISVNYDTCIACQKCESACPSSVMSVILRRNKTIPDCFACYTCREACPTHSISFSTRKRTVPPPDHFEKGRKGH